MICQSRFFCLAAQTILLFVVFFLESSPHCGSPPKKKSVSDSSGRKIKQYGMEIKKEIIKNTRVECVCDHPCKLKYI